ncbi:MAG TPA: DNA translocase FtsK, partial [Myxococcota bacterium]|nr:DNA translocase FtsK [Myxococcota bacterium]
QILPGNLQSGGSNDDGRALRRAEHFELPPLGLLDDHPAIIGGHDDLALQDMARKLTAKLRTYGVEGRVVAIRPGPVITVFEYEPAPGVKLSKISSLSDDLKMALEAVSVRIVAPIPGRGVVGVEIPNRSRQIVWARDVFASREFRESGHSLPMILGKDTEGRPFVTDLAKMPHLLVGGTTGSGKSVGINAMLCSLLFTKPPEELRLILVDPKMLEFELYQEIPHLLHPVVTEAKLASAVLKWACVEMDERYRMLARWQTRNIEGYNGRAAKEMEDWTPEKAKRFGLEEGALPRKLPYIVIVIDELADLMMVAAKDVEESIVRLAQKARAAGIHLIVATQRPSVDVITGLIKANMPSRLAYQVRSKTDGRTILDQNGAETLLGKGDLLFLPPGTSGLIRVHGPLLTDEEVRRVADFVRAQGTPEYAPKLTIEEGDGEGEENLEEEMDENYDHAVSVAIELGRISTSMIQRRLKIGYNRAARIMEIMEREGVVGPADGARPREVLLGKN